VPGGDDPVANDLVEFIGGHAGMRGDHDLHERRLATCQGAFDVTFQQRGERLLCFPLRVLGCECLYAIEREQQLEIHGLLGPECAIVVEGGNSVVFQYEVGTPLPGNAINESNDGLLGLRVVP
jgi:hypothetical protein